MVPAQEERCPLLREYVQGEGTQGAREGEDEVTAEELAQRLSGRRFHEPMRQALELVRRGESYRAAADAEGVDYRELHRASSSVPGLLDHHRVAWRVGWGDRFPGIWDRHLDNPGPRGECRLCGTPLLARHPKAVAHAECQRQHRAEAAKLRADRLRRGMGT